MLNTAKQSRGFETSLRFSFEFISKLLVIWIVGFISFFVLTFSSFNHFSKSDKAYLFSGAKKTVVYTIKKHVPIFKGSLSNDLEMEVKEYRGILKEITTLPLTISFILSFIAPLGWLYFVKRTKATKDKENSPNEHIREYRKINKKANGIKLGGFNKQEHILIDKDKNTPDKKQEANYRKNSIVIPGEDETSHFFILGQSGTGKTVLIDQILADLKLRDKKMIIHDNKMDFTAKFYNPTKDYIFNPLDERSLEWNIFNDIDSIIDIESIANSLIPAPIGNVDPFWNNSARTILIKILKYLKENNLTSNNNIVGMLSLTREEMIQTLNCSTVTKLLEAEKQAASILSTLDQFTRSLQYLRDGDFSIKKWINSPLNNAIFITNRKDIKEMIAPLLTLFIDFTSKQLLSLDDNLNRRVYFILEELGMLNKLSSVVDLVTNGRSKGASIFITVQDLARLEEIYGREFNTIFASCATKIFFRIGDNFTVQYIKNYAGQVEIEKIDENIALGEYSEDGNLHIRKHLAKDDILKVAELTNLQDRVFKVKPKNFNRFLELKTYVKKFEKFNETFSKINF